LAKKQKIKLRFAKFSKFLFVEHMHSKWGKNAYRAKNMFLEKSKYSMVIKKRISMGSFSFSVLYLHIF
jgi:hypothetical protein